MAKDYYTILGVSRNASPEEVKKAFRTLAQKHHPDRGGSADRFKEISEAYSVLSNEKKRAEYDSYGQTFGGGGNAQGFGGFDFSQAGFNAADFQDFDLGDIFGDIFGGRRAKTKRGRDISIDIELTFKEAVFGAERKILLTKYGNCSACSGSGAAPGSEQTTCTTCNGNGSIHETKRSVLGAFTSVRTCDQCHGKGTVPTNKCKECHGEGITKKEEEIVVTIPPNVNNGEMIRMSGAGEAVAGGVPGDLYIKLHVAVSQEFERDGQHLLSSLKVKLTDAMLGAEYPFETLDGKISIKIPAGTSPNDILRVRGKGAPLQGSSKRGDLLITLNVELPKKLSRKAKKIVTELQQEGI